MKAKFLIIALILIVIGQSCKKESLYDRLQGQWIRTDNRSDTITFCYKSINDWFILNRGYKVESEGISRPVVPCGIYEYRIQDQNISMHWLASSNSVWPSYSFSISDSRIEIGNFIDNSSNTIQFEKLK